MMKYKRLILSLVFFFIMLSAPLYADDQAWINNSLTLKMNSELSLKLTNELRYFDITGLTPYKKNIQAGLVYKLPENFYLAFLYMRENEKRTFLSIYENRYTLETGWKTKIDKDIYFDCRFRTEIRIYYDGLAQNHLRFRFRIRLKANLKIGSLQLKPFIATEPFGDTKSDKIFRNRFYIGILFPLSKNVELVVNYIRQDTKGKETNHILNTGFDLKF